MLLIYRNIKIIKKYLKLLIFRIKIQSSKKILKKNNF